MLSKCCCCISLRVGCFILSIMGIVGGIIGLAYSEGNVLFVSEGVWWIIADTFLFIGCIKVHRKTILVALVLEIVALLDGVAILIFSFIGIEYVYPELANDCADMSDRLKIPEIDCEQTKSSYLQVMVGTICFNLALNTYFWICVFSFYKSLGTQEDNRNLVEAEDHVQLPQPNSVAETKMIIWSRY